MSVAATLPERLNASVIVDRQLAAGRGGSCPGGVELDAGVAGQDDALDPADTHRDDMAFWLYSSGSTGRPKGVVHLQHDIDVPCESFAAGVLGMREDDVTFSTTK